MITFAAGVVTGIVVAVGALFVLRHELDLYRRVRGTTLDFTATSRERR